MSGFLVNLARRAAGLPAQQIQAPPLLPFAPEIHQHREGLGEELAAGDPANPSALPTSSLEAYGQLPSQAPIHDTPFVERFSGTEPSAPIPFAGEPATTASPPPHMSHRRVTSDGREAQATGLEPLGPAVPPSKADLGIIGVDSERGRHIPSPAQEIELGDEPPRHASHVTVRLSPIIRASEERQVLAPAEPSIERSWDEAQQTRESALLSPTIRPASAKSHTFLPFLRTTPASPPAAPSQLPIHVCIGRVEVRATTPPTPTPARPSPPTPLGFDGYYRLRTYRT